MGPIELAACMDLSEQAGSVTLTSPKLLKSKGRNYLLHIKTMTDLSKDGQAKTRGKLNPKRFTPFPCVLLSHHPPLARSRCLRTMFITILLHPLAPSSPGHNSDLYVCVHTLSTISMVVPFYDALVPPHTPIPTNHLPPKTVPANSP